MAAVNDLATFDLLVNGSAFAFSYDVLSITVVNEINRITTATIIIRDGEPSSQDFPVSDSSAFVPGATVEIKAGFNSTNSTIFKGIVTGHSVRCTSKGGPELVIEAKDTAVKMTIARNNAYYTTKTDSDIISALIGNYSGLSSDVDSTTYSWADVIQYYATDWDFMLARAEVNGMFVVTDQNKVSVKQFKTGSSAVTYTYGLDIYAFVAGIDARRQLTGVSAQGWDYKTQAIVSATAAEPSFPDQGNLSATSLTSATAPSAFLLSTTAPLETAPLQSWANAQLARSRYAKIKGSIKVLGTSTLTPGSFITLAGMGSRFNGDAFVSGIRHLIGDGEWFTTITTGIDDNWYMDKVQTMAQPTSGLLPGVRGLVNGTVKAITSDPDNETRVQLDIPVIAASGDGVWARMGNQYATNGAGFFWMPEIGDEVVVGFLNDDPRFPVILGSMYSGQKAPPYTPDDQNSKKGIWSNSKIYIEFDDQNKNLTITTPGANKIIFSDQNQNITIQDQNSNKVVMSSSGIQLTSPKDIELTASGSVKITGTQGVNITSSAAMDLQATQGLTAKGLTVAISSDTEMTVKGGTTAEFSSGVETTLKGAMVMIN
jgi:Rhs element Vgr protein